MVSGGGNVLALARMLGHQSPKETLETYADLSIRIWTPVLTSSMKRVHRL